MALSKAVDKTVENVSVLGVPGCGGTFTKSEGIIQSAHLDSGDLSVCEYKIQQTPDRKIKINFIKFDLSGPGGCTFNYVEVSLILLNSFLLMEKVFFWVVLDPWRQ